MTVNGENRLSQNDIAPPQYGSLCTGIGGLDLAVEAHFGAVAAWHSEIDPAPSTIVEARWPSVPNLGDLKQIDWASVPAVDVLTAGYPCQPFSHAGKRKGTDDPRHLWPHIIEGIHQIRPRYVVLENVRGHLSLGFGDVLGGLAAAGFDAEWCVLRASDVGACHQRARLFVVASVVDDAQAAPHAGGERHGSGQDARAVGRVDGGHEGEARQRQRARQEPGDRGAAAPANTQDQQQGGAEGVDTATLERTSTGAGDRAGAGHPPEGVRVLGRGPGVEWGVYEPAVRRWESVLGRPAPRPVDDAGRLSPPFVEWMMGYPQGWVDGLTRTQALKALGNAVVPQQGLAALRELAPDAALIGAAA